MDGIVVGIAQINFQQNFSGISSENSEINIGTIMSVCNNTTSGDRDCSSKVLYEVDSMTDGAWEGFEDDLVKKKQNEKGYTFGERRQMPARASKGSSLLGVKRRTIIKPTKRVKSHVDFPNLKPSDIKKIYLNKNLTKFKPSSLETIFEETSNCCNNEQNYGPAMGGRKIRRLLSLSDGFRCSKTLLNKRRAKIKKAFGKRFALKKVSLEEFIAKLNTNIQKNENDANHKDKKDHKGELNEEITHNDNLVLNSSDSLHDSKPLTCTGPPHVFKTTTTIQ